MDDGQFLASRHLTPVESTHADHVFDGECPLSGSVLGTGCERSLGAVSNAAILQDELIDYVKGINVSAAVDEAKRLFDSVLDQKNYVAALRYFNCKGMVALVARTLDISARVYTKIVMGVLKEDRGVADKMRNLIGA